MLLFLMTGLAIVVYLNQTPLQPRERDYAYAGSFYAFAIWIGMGVGMISEKVRVKSAKYATALAILSAIACFIIAAPIAYYIGRQWLQSFAERTPIYWWLFPLALLTVGVITLTTVIIQSWRTANENPINSIKNE